MNNKNALSFLSPALIHLTIILTGRQEKKPGSWPFAALSSSSIEFFVGASPYSLLKNV